MALINDALESGSKISTGYIDEDLPVGKSAVGCNRKGCINGYVETSDGRMEYCECYKEHLFYLKLQKAHIPSEYYPYKQIDVHGLKVAKKPYSRANTYLKEVDVNQDIRNILTNVDRILEEGWNFIIEGPTGSGKTTFGAILARIVLSKGHSALFLELEEFRRLFTGEDLPPDLSDAKKQIYNVDILVLDDLGKEYKSESSDHFVVKLDSVIRQRIADKKTTVFTTNLTAENVSIRYDERLMSLLQKRMIHYVLHRNFDLREETALPDFLI